MSFINCGAIVNGKRPATKSELKRALTAEPANVLFDTTSVHGPRSGDIIRADIADIGAYRLSVAGPDPYRTRKWYATVAVSKGKIQVS